MLVWRSMDPREPRLVRSGSDNSDYELFMTSVYRRAIRSPRTLQATAEKPFDSGRHHELRLTQLVHISQHYVHCTPTDDDLLAFTCMSVEAAIQILLRSMCDNQDGLSPERSNNPTRSHCPFWHRMLLTSKFHSSTLPFRPWKSDFGASVCNV